jgi:tryptophan synthase beta chain
LRGGSKADGVFSVAQEVRNTVGGSFVSLKMTNQLKSQSCHSELDSGSKSTPVNFVASPSRGANRDRHFDQILPDYIIACIGGGSNAIGAFDQFLEYPEVNLIGVEQGGSDSQEGNHSTRIANHQAKMGILEGFKSKFLLKEGGQVMAAGGVSAGLGYVGIGPFHAYLHSIGRISINSVTDQEVVAAFKLIARTEGLLVALESCHAVAEAIKIAPTLSKDKIIVINLSGRADNYIFNIAFALDDKKFEEFRKG